MRRVDEEEEAKAAAKAQKKAGGGKGKGKAKAEPTDAETTAEDNKAKNKVKNKPRAQKSELELAVEDKFKRAEQLVRKVWAKHPNFGHLVEALLEGGLEELEERIGLSVGESFGRSFACWAGGGGPDERLPTPLHRRSPRTHARIHHPLLRRHPHPPRFPPVRLGSETRRPARADPRLGRGQASARRGRQCRQVVHR